MTHVTMHTRHARETLATIHIFGYSVYCIKHTQQKQVRVYEGYQATRCSSIVFVVCAQ
jgi:hypothetical protein